MKSPYTLIKHCDRCYLVVYRMGYGDSAAHYEYMPGINGHGENEFSDNKGYDYKKYSSEDELCKALAKRETVYIVFYVIAYGLREIRW